MDFEDKTLVCADCGEEFIFSAQEQEFFSKKGFENEPKRCKTCRTKKKEQRRGGFGPQKMYPAVCSECGKETEVPFRPTEGRAVYCKECYQSKGSK